MVVGDVKPVFLENYQEDREHKGGSAATIDMELSIAKTMVNKAFDNDMVDGRVLKAFRRVKRKLKKGSNARKRTLTFAEFLLLVEKASEHLKGILIVAFNTGMRPGEILSLKWSYIDRKAMFIRLPKKVTKEKKEKDIPINHYVRSVLNGLHVGPKLVTAGHHDFVFTYRGRPISNPGGVKRSFRTACKNAKIPYGRDTENGLIMHDIRRTVKTNMLNAGVDKVHRDWILGHSLKGMDVHYLTPDDNTLKQAMDKFTRWIDDQFQNVDQSVDQDDKNAENVDVIP